MPAKTTYPQVSNSSDDHTKAQPTNNYFKIHLDKFIPQIYQQEKGSVRIVEWKDWPASR